MKYSCLWFDLSSYQKLNRFPLSYILAPVFRNVDLGQLKFVIQASTKYFGFFL